MTLAVFTALIGGYERPVFKKTFEEVGVSYICFTDNPDLVMEGWQIRTVEPLFPYDSVRSARALKIRGHALLADYQEHLWLDNRIELNAPPSELFDLLLPGEAEFGAPLHSFRQTVHEEFIAVLRHGYDDPRRVREQLSHYVNSAPQTLQEHPIWTGILARRNSAEVRHFSSIWADQVMRYSRRDQLSLRYALSRTKVNAHYLVLDNVNSRYHTWIDEAAMQRRSNVSRWNLGQRPLGAYTFRDFTEDGYWNMRKRLAPARQRVRNSRVSKTLFEGHNES